MKYSLVFLALATANVFAGLAAWDVLGWGSVLFFGFAVTSGLLALAYAGVCGRGLGKRADGRHSVAGWAAFGPYFLLSVATFWAYRCFSRECAFARVVPNLYFGRRLTPGEARAVTWVRVLDLAAEFTETRPLRESPGYRSIPVLDTTAPTESQLRAAIGEIEAGVRSGPVYVHCALGHGRSACVVVAYLLSTGHVARAADGVRLLRSLRPGVRLNAAQNRGARAFESGGPEA
ncbi:dual specificity protein phosphatase family protein [Fimbriiglobus ruber]|uniref:dual specificity protein phosphatase family protein n=1 Tax=Fimbriiglobus ruber TaxID=1908690 RepID=UPI000B4B5143|nr:dual specificity protein phosphatase family protein [Fimbriiglobus ruber]